MSQNRTHSILAAAAAATIALSGAAFADDGACKSACEAGGSAARFISAEAPQAQSAEEMLAEYRAVELPRFDPSKREDKEYAREFHDRQVGAYTRRAELGRAFVLAHPAHPDAVKVFRELMGPRMYVLDQKDQVEQDIQALLERDDLPEDARKSLRVLEVEATMTTQMKPGEPQEQYKARHEENLEAAWEKVQELRKEYDNDPQIASIMARVAESTRGEKQVERLEETLAAFPDSPALKYTEGKLRQIRSIGEPFEISFTDALTGREITTSDLHGKVVVVDFWATWCGPCIAEMPKMKELYAQYKDQGVEFIGVSLDAPEEQGGKDKLLEYCSENNINWPQYYQGKGWDSEFSTSWGINSIPAIFIVDADGNLHSTNARGKLETLIPELIAQRDGNGTPRQAAGQD